MKKIIVLFCLLSAIAAPAQNAEKDAVEKLLDNWHSDAADAQMEAYFAALAPDAIYIGTDATEHWSVEKFREFAKPYFHNKKTWKFKPVQRHIFINEAKDMAWFDELLDTEMKICRGSGVLRKGKDGWKIVHYVLSMTVPNDNIEAVLKIKSPLEDAYLSKLKGK